MSDPFKSWFKFTVAVMGASQACTVPHLKTDKSSELCREPRCHGVFYHHSINHALPPCLYNEHKDMKTKGLAAYASCKSISFIAKFEQFC